jgi:hypothetical protein
MRTVELLIDEEQEDFGVEAISLVKFPAIEENFVYFNKEQKLTLAKIDEDRAASNRPGADSGEDDPALRRAERRRV